MKRMLLLLQDLRTRRQTEARLTAALSVQQCTTDLEVDWDTTDLEVEWDKICV